MSTTAAIELLDLVFPPPREFAIRLWDEQVLPADREEKFTLVISTPGSLRRMFRVPVELSLGEAYLLRDFDIEGDLIAAFELPHVAREQFRSAASVATLAQLWRKLPRGDAGDGLDARAPARLRGSEHSRDRDRAAIQYHYDVGNDFYALFLDQRMIYSCGYFETPEQDLDSAQEAKLELICRKLRLHPGDRLLDVGCGWGGMLVYAAERYGIEGVGVTLSEQQYRLVKDRVAAAALSDRVHIQLCDYRDLDDPGFDKIVSIGMFEHVGRDRFDEYFIQLFRLLRPGGLFLNHAIASRPPQSETARSAWVTRALDRYFVGNEAFRKRYIFPDGELAPLSIANLQAEQAGFEVRDVENLREHYALTLRHWLARLRDRREEALQVAGEAVFRLWEMYLAASIYHFETARLNINQTLFSKPDQGESHVPLTRADLYRSEGEMSGEPMVQNWPSRWRPSDPIRSRS